MQPVSTNMAAKLGKGVAKSEMKVLKPPGHYALKWASLIFSKSFTEKIVEPTILDLQEEYVEACANSGPLERKWIVVRGYVSFAVALFLGLTTGVAKKCFDAWRALNSG